MGHVNNFTSLNLWVPVMSNVGVDKALDGVSLDELVALIEILEDQGRCYFIDRTKLESGFAASRETFRIIASDIFHCASTRDKYLQGSPVSRQISRNQEMDFELSEEVLTDLEYMLFHEAEHIIQEFISISNYPQERVNTKGPKLAFTKEAGVILSDANYIYKKFSDAEENMRKSYVACQFMYGLLAKVRSNRGFERQLRKIPDFKAAVLSFSRAEDNKRFYGGRSTSLTGHLRVIDGGLPDKGTQTFEKFYEYLDP